MSVNDGVGDSWVVCVVVVFNGGFGHPVGKGIQLGG